MLHEFFGTGLRDWPAVNLPRLLGLLSESVRGLQSRGADPEMLFVRLCDAFRGMDLDVPRERLWLEARRGVHALKGIPAPLGALLGKPMHDEAWNRVHLQIDSLRDGSMMELVRQQTVELGPDRVLIAVFLGFARWEEVLSLDLLLKNSFRIEEFARKWIAALGGSISGESPRESERRLKKLDYRGILKDLKRAQESRDAHLQNQREQIERRLREEYERTMRE